MKNWLQLFQYSPIQVEMEEPTLADELQKQRALLAKEMLA